MNVTQSFFAKPRRKRLACHAHVLRDCALVVFTALLTLCVLCSSRLLPPRSERARLSLAPPPGAARARAPRTGSAVRQASQDTPPADANVAYFVQVAESTAGHLPRLLSRIHHPGNVYAIHFDMKMDKTVVANLTASLFEESPYFRDNVHVMDSELITYRGVSMVLNTINAMKFLLERNSRWHYFINLSGSDYPLVSPALTRSLLGPHVPDELNFITPAARERWDVNIDHRMQHFYVDEALSFNTGPTVVVHVYERNPIASMLNFQYVSAEAWMINSRDFCRFVVTDGYARKMLLSFAYSVEASEHYFSTLLWNHPRYNRTVAHRALRHVIWKHDGKSAGQHPFMVDQKEPDGSYTFKDDIRDSPNLFIRKFKDPNSPLMDFIDGRLNDPEHVTAVRNLFKWVTGMSLDARMEKDAAAAAA